MFYGHIIESIFMIAYWTLIAGALFLLFMAIRGMRHPHHEEDVFKECKEKLDKLPLEHDDIMELLQKLVDKEESKEE
jgi:hypothetical protein